MKESDRKKRNEDRLMELYPTFRARVRQVLGTLEASGIRPRIQDAWRSPEDQEIAFRNGFSKLRFGFHNITAEDGTKEALAVDILDDNAPLKPGRDYLLRLAAAAEEAGLVTGIRWGLPKRCAAAIDEATATHNWRARVKIGWDPTHVEPKGLSIAEARSGRRPD
ncbi:hypothetical protein JW905_07870 [bacterium]|nr:hypothetical protein [candidate division CSSED10-310 bacterium]